MCYCFMHSRGEIERELLAGGGSHPMGESTVQRRITEQTKAGNCACEVRNAPLDGAVSATSLWSLKRSATGFRILPPDDFGPRAPFYHR